MFHSTRTMQVDVGNRNEVTSGDVIMGWIRWEDSEKSVWMWQAFSDISSQRRCGTIGLPDAIWMMSSLVCA